MQLNACLLCLQECVAGSQQAQPRTSSRAIAAPVSREAKMSQGPIIQPRLVGQATTSPDLMSMFASASVPHLSGVTWVQGMALGSPAASKGCVSAAELSGWQYLQGA